MIKNHLKAKYKIFAVGNYIIFYATDDDLQIVNIIRILYGKMDLSKISE